MKYILLLLLFLSFTIFHSNAQTNKEESLLLAVEKIKNSKTKELLFKTNKRIKIHTSGGRLIVGSIYSLVQNSIVLNTVRSSYVYGYSGDKKQVHSSGKDTIMLSEIDWIKGTVFEDEGRKVAGFMLTLVSIPAAYLPLVAAAWGGITGTFILLAIPVAALMSTGISMMGPRKFKTTKGWKIKIRPELSQLISAPPNDY